LRNAVYSNGVIVESTSHTEISCVWVREMRASIFSGRIEVVASHALQCRGQLVQHQPHPQLRYLVHDDEQHLVVLTRQGLLRRQELLELQVFAVGHEDPRSQCTASSASSTRSDLSYRRVVI